MSSALSHSLESVLNEGKKESNVDIQFMLATSERCHKIVQQLAAADTNFVYAVRPFFHFHV